MHLLAMGDTARLAASGGSMYDDADMPVVEVMAKHVPCLAV